jgi:hypothetical protein
MILKPLTLPFRIGISAARTALQIADRALSLFDRSQTDRHTSAPEQRTPAPERRTPAPEQRTPAPEQRSPAPEQRSPAPEHGTPTSTPEGPAPEAPITRADEFAKTVDDEPELVMSSADPAAADGAGAQIDVEPPFEGYDSLTAQDIIDHLSTASPEEAALIELYEPMHRNRPTVLAAAERRLRG